MKQDAAVKRNAQDREFLTKGGSKMLEKDRVKKIFSAAAFVLLGATLLAGGCATGSTGQANSTAGGTEKASPTMKTISGMGSMGQLPGQCMGGAGGEESGATSSGMGSCR